MLPHRSPLPWALAVARRRALAFAADTSGLDQAWVVSLEGGEPTQLTHFGERIRVVAARRGAGSVVRAAWCGRQAAIAARPAEIARRERDLGIVTPPDRR